jgi:ketosteroid isomerase-like protein
VEALEAVGLEE